MMDFFNRNIVWILGLVGIIYIAGDLYRMRREGKLKKEVAQKSFKGFQRAISEAKFKDYAFAFFVFLGMFLLIRGVVIAQNEMQECKVSLNNEMISALNYNSDFDLRERSEYNKILDFYRDEIYSVEQERSYNFYRRWFGENGGRPGFVNIECEFKLSYKRFIKNIKLDMSEVGI